MTYLLRTGYNWQALKMYDADCTVANPFYNPEVKQVVAASRICAYCNRSVVVLDPRALGDTVLCHAAVLIGGPVVLRPDNGTASNTESAKLSGVQGLLGAFNAIEASSTSGRFSDDGCKYRTSLGDEFRTGVEVLRAMGGGVSASPAAALPSEGWEVMWSNCDDAGMAAVSTAIPAQPTCVSAPAFATSVHLVGGQKRHVVDAPIKRGPYRRKGAIENLNWLTVLSGGLNVSLRPAPCSLNGAHCSRVRALLNPGDVGTLDPAAFSTSPLAKASPGDNISSDPDPVTPHAAVVYRQKMWAASVTVVGPSAAFTRHTAKYDLAAAIAQDDEDRS